MLGERTGAACEALGGVRVHFMRSRPSEAFAGAPSRWRRW